MSFSVDVNILVYASDSSSALHPKASAFLKRCATDRELFYLTWPVVMGYLRISTHPSIFAQPLSSATAMANIGSLIAQRHVHMVNEGEDFWQTYREATTSVLVAGNLVPDAYLASILYQNGIKTLYTSDRDFRKFDFLRAINPFE